MIFRLLHIEKIDFRILRHHQPPTLLVSFLTSDTNQFLKLKLLESWLKPTWIYVHWVLRNWRWFSTRAILCQYSKVSSTVQLRKNPKRSGKVPDLAENSLYTNNCSWYCSSFCKPIIINKIFFSRYSSQSRHGVATLVLHEAYPGHHLQVGSNFEKNHLLPWVYVWHSFCSHFNVYHIQWSIYVSKPNFQGAYLQGDRYPTFRKV